MNAVVKLVPQNVFIKRVHELSGILKKVEQLTPAALDIIVDTMNNKETDPKLKVACATALVDMQIKITDQISKDQLVRQIAELKKNGLSTPLGDPDGHPKKLPPTKDFSTIQEVF